MSKARITIAVPDKILTEARRAVRSRQATSVSAYFTEAAREHGRADELRRLLAELNDENGRPSAEAYAWARRILGT